MKNATLSEKVYLALKDQLFEMESGDFLSIRHCAARYGVSYTPMREAFLRLQEEGLLRKISNVGYFVQKPDYIDFQQIFQVRKCIEPYALMQTFQYLTEQDIFELEAINAEIWEVLEKRDWLHLFDADIAFHQTFVDKCRNKYLTELYIAVRNRYKNFTLKNLSSLPPDELENNREHMLIIEAIRQRDLEQALQYLNQHIDALYDRITRRCFPHFYRTSLNSETQT